MTLAHQSSLPDTDCALPLLFNLHSRNHSSQSHEITATAENGATLMTDVVFVRVAACVIAACDYRSYNNNAESTYRLLTLLHGKNRVLCVWSSDLDAKNCSWQL